MKILYFFCYLTVFSIFGIASDIPRVSKFDGSKVIYDLLGGPMPQSFFETTASVAINDFANEYNFRGQMQLSLDDKERNVTALLVNNCDYVNAIVVTGILQGSDVAKKYLIQIPAMAELELDVTELRNYSVVYFNSMSSFSVFFDTTINQDGKLVQELSLLPPKAELISDNDDTNSKVCAHGTGYLQVTNLNGPAAGGSAVGFFDVASSATTTLNVYYPTRSTILHKNVPLPPGSPTCTDSYLTKNSSGRTISWYGVMQVIDYGYGFSDVMCISAAAPDTCLVMSYGVPENARWSLSKD